VSTEVAALLLTVLVHVIGAAILVWNMLAGGDASWRELWPRDDRGGGEPPPDPRGPPMAPPQLAGEYSAKRALPLSDVPQYPHAVELRAARER
jgi:hypothetical protein